jgi:hypothetical protein
VADAGIKKATVFKEDLPAVDANTVSYNVRYRIVSENKNRFSAWSPIVSIDAVATTLLDFSIAVNNSAKLVTVAWNPNPVLGLSGYDIFVRWIGNRTDTLINYPWAFATTTSINSHLFAFPSSIPDPTGGTEIVKHIEVAAQRPTYQKLKENYPTSTSLTLFQTPKTTV